MRCAGHAGVQGNDRRLPAARLQFECSNIVVNENGLYQQLSYSFSALTLRLMGVTVLSALCSNTVINERDSTSTRLQFRCSNIVVNETGLSQQLS